MNTEQKCGMNTGGILKVYGSNTAFIRMAYDGKTRTDETSYDGFKVHGYSLTIVRYTLL